MPAADDDIDARRSIDAWAASGAMHLTGPAQGRPLGPPAPLVARLEAVADVLGHRSSTLGRKVRAEPLRLLGERAAIAGLSRNGRTSCGGGARLIRTGDGWMAVSLARPEDVDLVAAWLGLRAAPADADVWEVVAASAADRPTSTLAGAAAVLGLPVGALPSTPVAAPATPPPLRPLPCHATRIGDAAPTERLDEVVVVDLTSLWAGPLCGSLLADAGAHVLKLESTQRPDGARRGPAAFFDLLNAGKRSVALDFTTDAGRHQLGALLARADVVVEASRPRALEQLGVDAESLLADGRPRVWVSITGHGRSGGGRDRVGFGDDAAVAGGLVAWDGDEPSFCADAVADPTSGLVAAAATLEALATGGSWLLDVALSGVAAHLAGPTLPVPPDVHADAPSARPPRGTAPELGAHTDEVLDELGIRA